MNTISKTIVLILGIFLFCGETYAQDYSNYAQVSQRINALSKSYPALLKVKSLVKTFGGKDVWMLTIGNGQTEQKPAIAIFGGVEGAHLLGTEIALGFAEKLLNASSQDSIKNLLVKNYGD